MEKNILSMQEISTQEIERALGIQRPATEETLQSIDSTLKRIETILCQKNLSPLKALEAAFVDQHHPMAPRRIIESERITNLDDYEKVIQEARTDMVYLRAAIKRKEDEAVKHLAEQLDLKLHQLEAFEFQIERRTVIGHDHSECQ